MKFFSRVTVPAFFLFTAIVFSGPAQNSWADGRLVSTTTRMSFHKTVSEFKKLVSQNGMMLLGTINQGKVMGMTGLSLKSETFFIGNPVMGKKLFEAQKGAGVLIPVRVNIYVNGKGQTVLSYLQPSAELADFHNPVLIKMGSMLDKNLSMMASMLH